MSYGVEPCDATPAIIIYGSFITEMDPTQWQALAGLLAATVGARATVSTVDLGDHAALYERKVTDLTVGEEVPPFTLLLRPDPKQYPRHGNKPDYHGTIAAIDERTPDIIEDPGATVKALAAVFHHGHQSQGPSLSAFPDAPWLRANSLHTITFRDPQTIVNHAGRSKNMIPMLGPKNTRALGLFVIASTRTWGKSA